MIEELINIAFVGEKLNDALMKYSIIDRKVLVISWCTNKSMDMLNYAGNGGYRSQNIGVVKPSEMWKQPEEKKFQNTKKKD
jgi:hypothetical protein